MKDKVKAFFRKYGITIAVIAIIIGIICYFVNIIVFENKKDVLNVLVLSSNIDIEQIEKPLYELIPVQDDEEIVIKYMDSTAEAEQAIILTWIRSRTVDVVIGDEDSMAFYAQNGCFMNLEECGIESDERDYYNVINEYSSEGQIIDTSEKMMFGKRVKSIEGILEMKNPIVALAVNSQNLKKGLVVLDYYVEIK